MIDVDDDNLWRVDLFKILDVTEETELKEIKQKYKSLAKKYHPDRFPAGSAEQEEAKEKFSDVSRAYDILTNDAKRTQYMDTRKLLADHLPEDQRPAKAESAPAAGTSSSGAKKSASPAAKAPEKKKEEASDFKRKEAQDCFEEGQYFFNKSKLDDAVESFQRAVSIMPDEAKFHSNLGRAYLMKGWNGMAQSSFKQALVLNPSDPIAKKHYVPEKPEKQSFFSRLFGGKKKK